jgi:transposase
MARYKQVDYTQAKLLPITFSRQILPGTFEHTLHHIVEHELDLSIFESKYKNDETGASAYDPAILLKIVLYAYSRGITSSREIEQCCRENVSKKTSKAIHPNTGNGKSNSSKPWKRTSRRSKTG